MRYAYGVTHEQDIFPEYPADQNPLPPLAPILDVTYHSAPPHGSDVQKARLGFVKQGYSMVTADVIRQTVGYPYRVEYRGVK